MNLLESSITIGIIDFLAVAALASSLSLSKADFKSAESSKQGTEVLVEAVLNSAGITKQKSLNQLSGQTIEIHLGGKVHHFKLREPIHEGKVQMGPFSTEMAQAIVKEINQH